MKNQAQRKTAAPETPAAPRPRVRMARGERRDPLAYRATPVEAPGPRPTRPAPAGHTARRRNRRRVPPVVLWNRRFRSLARFLSLTLCLEIVWLCLASPLLVVRTVSVEGAHVRTPQQIARIAGLTKPVNVFRAPVQKAGAALAALPEVESVAVERRLPRAIAVTVRERSPVAGVSIHGEWWAMDEDGLLFRKMSKPVANRPILIAAASGTPILGKKLKMPAMDAALKCLALLPGLPLSRSVELHVDAGNEAWLNNSDGLKIRLGPLDDAPARLAVTERLLKGPNGAEILKKALVLDMATPDNEVYKRREETDAYRLTGNTG